MTCLVLSPGWSVTERAKCYCLIYWLRLAKHLYYKFLRNLSLSFSTNRKTPWIECFNWKYRFSGRSFFPGTSLSFSAINPKLKLKSEFYILVIYCYSPFTFENIYERVCTISLFNCNFKFHRYVFPSQYSSLAFWITIFDPVSQLFLWKSSLFNVRRIKELKHFRFLHSGAKYRISCERPFRGYCRLPFLV